MRAMLVPVDGVPYPVEVGGLSDMQGMVGGCIEPVGWLFDDAPAVYVNEEGKFSCEPNRALYATRAGERWDGTPIREGDLLDIAYGPMLCVGYDPETGESRDITDDEMARVAERFGDETVGSGPIEAAWVSLTGQTAVSARTFGMMGEGAERDWRECVRELLATRPAGVRPGRVEAGRGEER